MLERHMMPSAVNAPLENRPDRLNPVRMNQASHIFFVRMIDGFMGEPFPFNTLITGMVIGVKGEVARFP